MSEKHIVKTNKNNFTPQGIVFLDEKIALFESEDKKGGHFRFSWSTDGITFTTDYEKVSIYDGLITHKSDQCTDFRFSYIGKKVYAVYNRLYKKNKYRVIAEIKDIYEWEVISEEICDGNEGILVAEDKSRKNHLMYSGGNFVKCHEFKHFDEWNKTESLVFTSRYDRFDRDLIRLIGSYVSDRGILIFYESLVYENNVYKQVIGLVITDKLDPSKVIWRSQDPVWSNEVSIDSKNKTETLGMAIMDNNLYFLFLVDNALISVSLSEIDIDIHIPLVKSKTLIKHKKNPIISPHAINEWESEAIFNPAVLQDDKGHLHLIYRAIGSDGVSRLGYGYSKDGLNFNGRLPVPVYSMKNPREGKNIIQVYDPIMYPSGGSWGGCEDPRMVKIDGKIYLSFNAFDGWDYIRIAVVSIDEKDFMNGNWKWSRPVLISPPNQINKNWVIFPEKINCKFAILHSISPKVQIDYVDKLEDLESGKHIIRSHFKQDPDKKGWDSWVRGAGPPPMRTDKGWLVLYHAMDKRDPNKYKLGVLLLDINDPSKVISRSYDPILEPEMWYENDWKPGVVYSCGAVIKDETLYVYYGGGDKHICVATAPLSKVFEKLK